MTTLRASVAACVAAISTFCATTPPVAAQPAGQRLVIDRPATRLPDGTTTAPRRFVVDRPEAGTFVPGVVIVKTRSRHVVGKGDRSLGAGTLAAAIDYVMPTSVQYALFDERPRPNDPAVMATGVDRIVEIRYAEPLDPFLFCQQLMKDPDVEYAVPKFVHKLSYNPNDARLSQQTYLSTMNMARAWDISKGDKSIIVAIIDSGTDTDHEDLAPQIWKNTDEIAGNGIDDDNNGYVDDVRGWDFVGSVSGLEVQNGILRPDADPKVSWPQMTPVLAHGTATAGCAAALANNAKGIAGTGFNVTIMPLKCGSDNPAVEAILEGYRAIRYAADNGAHVINCSWGGFGADPSGQDVINYAVAKGSVVVAATGNSGADMDNTPHYPACYDNVLAVGAVDDASNNVNFSNYGSRTTTFAPGQDILSTYPNNQYVPQTGTSFSCPLVAGVVALLRAKHPDWTPAQLIMHIRGTSRAIPSVPAGDRIKRFGITDAGQALTVNASLTTGTRAPGIYVSDVKVGAGSAITSTQPVTVDLTLANILAEAGATSITVSSSSPRVAIKSPAVTSVASIAAGGTTPLQITVQLDSMYPWYSATADIDVTVRSGSFTNIQRVSVPVSLPTSNQWSVAVYYPVGPYTAIAEGGSSDLWIAGYAYQNGAPFWFNTQSGRSGLLPIAPVTVKARPGGRSWIGGYAQTGGAIVTTSSAGSSWTTANLSSLTSAIVAIDMLDDREGWALGNQNASGRFAFVQTRDGGATWTATAGQPAANRPSETIVPNTFQRTSAWMGFLTSTGRFVRSANKGSTWLPSTIAAGTPLAIGVGFRDDQNGIALYRTSDASDAPYAFSASSNGGVTWTSLKTMPAFSANPIQLLSANGHVIVVFDDGSAWASDDGATTWKPLLSSPQGTVRAAVLSPNTAQVLYTAGDFASRLGYRFVSSNGPKILQFVTESLDFGILRPSQERTRTIGIRNVGTGTARIDSVQLVGSDVFSLGTMATDVAGGTSASFSVKAVGTTDGTFTATARLHSNADPAVIELPIVARIETPVSVIDPAANAVITTAPNPASATTVVVLPGDRPANLRIVDVAGATVRTEAMPAGTTRFTVDCTTLAPGTYRMIVTGDGIATTLPLVIVR